MAGTIYSGTDLTGIVLGDPATQFPATVTGSVSNKDGDAIYGKPVARWTITNIGAIENTGSTGYGIDLVSRGTVTNRDGALITGNGGVRIRRKAGRVSNYGTITGTNVGGDGVHLRAGGRVINGSDTALISGGRHAVLLGGAGNVSNFGTLASSGTSGVVDLLAGGHVFNDNFSSAKALISGAGRGVYISGGIGTVTNYGTIKTGWGVVLSDGGRVANGIAGATAALISATANGVDIAGGAGRVSNFGLITSSGARRISDAIYLHAGGSVVNGSASSTGALISGTTGYANAINISGAAGSVANFGTIKTNDGYGVFLRSGGSVINGSATSTSALITGAIEVLSGTGRVTNFGTIGGLLSSGVRLRSGGEIINGSSASTAAVMGDVGIYGGTGTVINFGMVGGVDGVALSDGGKVINGSSASTAALTGSGILILGAAGTVINFGTVGPVVADGFPFSNGVQLIDGGRVVNGSHSVTTAQILGEFGVQLYGVGTITNFGTIDVEGSGIIDPNPRYNNSVVLGSNGSTLTNFGTIEGSSKKIAGVFARADAIANFGTISGGSGVAVQIATGDAGKLVVEPGAVFVGKILGGGVSEIDFAARGVADVSNVSGFATIGLLNGHHHTLTVTSANFAAVVGAAITVDDGNSGNTVTAATLPAADRIIVHAGVGLDKLTGGRGNDVFFAGGDTVMTGKAGTNEFTFSAPGGNTVGDFAVSATNEIVFSDKGFSLGLSGASGTPQALPSGLFVENSDGHFTGTSQRFAYATGTGDLSYSASGSSGTPTLVSHLTGAPSLAASQLFFIT